jgi:hypothetical protein
VSRLWDKGEPLDERVLRYTAGEDHRLDERLVSYDVRASLAHAAMLHEVGLLSAEDLAAIRGGLEALGKEHAAGSWRIALEDEDAHTALESRLTARIGEAGARLHLGRSRNDQVLAALRLYLRDVIAALADGAREALAAGYVSGGTRRNLDWVRPHLAADGVPTDELLLLADAQTSGGLLVAGDVPGYPVVGELVAARPDGVTLEVR